MCCVFFSSRRRHTRCALVTGVQTCALPICFQAETPAGTILHSKVIPPVGGDTLYADGTAAYDALSPVMQKMLAGVTAIHSAALPYGTKGIFAHAQASAKDRTMQIIVSPEADKT